VEGSTVPSLLYPSGNGRAIAQAIIRRFPTTAARVLFQIRSCVTFGGLNSTAAGFHRLIGPPLQIRIPRNIPY
jgi:hypothetical protein